MFCRQLLPTQNVQVSAQHCSQHVLRCKPHSFFYPFLPQLDPRVFWTMTPLLLRGLMISFNVLAPLFPTPHSSPHPHPYDEPDNFPQASPPPARRPFCLIYPVGELDDIPPALHFLFDYLLLLLLPFLTVSLLMTLTLLTVACLFQAQSTEDTPHLLGRDPGRRLGDFGLWTFHINISIFDLFCSSILFLVQVASCTGTILPLTFLTSTSQVAFSTVFFFFFLPPHFGTIDFSFILGAVLCIWQGGEVNPSCPWQEWNHSFFLTSFFQVLHVTKS